ncbi:MAG: GDP-mannose 4,6-dehydratase [uncultured Truepera sp.]|uniref:GDP-mannose 4,6-dehydratase n=1 Tax=uncultured Truepera sp. TaxID=543023 RepID=A0A6J4VUT9_9DEIN|nr:MAG: GDP-mannose 4,6-dehydratase [uncultured Truepera sp.]
MPEGEPIRVLITGAGGFVGPYLARHLTDLGAKVWGGGLSEDTAENYRAMTLDVTDAAQVARVMQEVRPGEVYHLAGVTRPASGDTAAFYAVNLHGTLNVLEAAQETGAAVLVVGSAYVYGAQTGTLTERAELKPVNHYGASKAAADLAGLPYALAGNRVVRVRPFNHVGPGQSPDFLLPTLVQQLARIEVGALEPVIKLGNLDSVRDFTDVRDIVRAYPKLLREGKNGDVYNLASGRGVSVRELAEMVLARARREIRLQTEPARVRATDIPELVGDAGHAREAVGWTPEIPLETTLDEMLTFERAKYV